MKRSLIAAALVVCVLGAAKATAADEKVYTIGILNWLDVPHNLEAIDGFHKVLDLGQVPHVIDQVNVRGDEEQAMATLRKWKQEKVDLICAVGTGAARLAIQEVTDIPIVFTAVTNPVLSGIAESWDHPGRNVTGSSNWIGMADKLRIFKECVPHMKRLGVIYDPDNPVPVAEVAEARDKVESMGITLHEVTIKKADEIAPAVAKLAAENIDALWVPIEKLVYENMPEVAREARPRRLPVVSSTLKGLGLEQGDPITLLAVTVDYEHLGRLSAQTAIDILAGGKAPGDIPIRTMSRYSVVVNANAAATIGYTVPSSCLAKANKIIRGYEGQTVTVAGTGDSQHLLRELAKALMAELDGGKIEVPDSIGSSGGVRALIAGKADLARVARPLKESETSAGLTYKLFAMSPVVFVAHPSVQGMENVTTKDIVGVYSGRISKWETLGAERGRIYVVTRESGDSCLTVLNKLVPGFKDIEEQRAKVFYSSQEARDALADHRNTFGFLPMSVAAGTNLKVLSVDGVYPSTENVRNGTYKLAVPLGIVYKDKPTGLAGRFLDFLFSDQARAIITAAGAVPVASKDNQHPPD